MGWVVTGPCGMEGNWMGGPCEMRCNWVGGMGG